jgi:hypothetical protein
MNTYQVFNPQTGTHIRCASEDAAKAMILEIAKHILTVQIISANKEIVHENGDVTWEPVDFASSLKVTL